MTDDKNEPDVDDLPDGLDTDFDNAGTSDLKKGQDTDDTGDAPNGGQ